MMALSQAPEDRFTSSKVHIASPNVGLCTAFAPRSKVLVPRSTRAGLDSLCGALFMFS